MPLSDLEKASTRRMPYGTKAAAGTNITRTSTGGSVGPEKVTLHQGGLLLRAADGAGCAKPDTSREKCCKLLYCQCQHSSISSAHALTIE